MINSRNSDIQSYFMEIAQYGKDLLNRLPIEREPQPLDYALSKLSPIIDQIKQQEIARISHLHRPTVSKSHEASPGVGLNSIGMLSDRFTILIIKEWCLRNKSTGSDEKADSLFENQTMDIIMAMANSQPGSSSMNSKITNIKGDAVATSWESAIYGLLTTNLVLWESQEILYILDIGELPVEELRSYIKWFSYGNIRRNEYIQFCEELYWK